MNRYCHECKKETKHHDNVSGLYCGNCGVKAFQLNKKDKFVWFIFFVLILFGIIYILL